MKIGNLIVGVIVVAFAALLLADGILSYVDPSSQFLSLGSVEGLVGFSVLVLAASYFQKAKE
jgi:hypothetical protein